MPQVRVCLLTNLIDTVLNEGPPFLAGPLDPIQGQYSTPCQGQARWISVLRTSSGEGFTRQQLSVHPGNEDSEKHPYPIPRR